jgi:choline-sulfatase
MEPANLVFIMADEHNAAFMGCAGHPMVKTPRLDRLARSGTRFTAAYTPSPLCVPARAAMATGRHVHETGYWDGAIAYDGRVRGWPHRVSETGHPVASIGKLHYRGPEVDTGFDETIEAMHLADGVGDVQGLLREAMPPKAACRRLADELGRGDSNYLRYDRRVTEAACSWIEREAARADDKPFALFISFAAPHYPLIAPPEFYDLYDGLDVPMPETLGPDDPALHPWVSAIRTAWPYDDYMDDEKRRIAVVAYLGLTSFMDANVGRVLDALDETGLGARTRVIYASDHGECLGNRGLWGKMTMYEDSALIPLIMAGPGIPAGREVDTPVSLIDICPTVLAALGEGPGESGRDLPGRSLIGIANEADDPGRAILSQYHGAGAAGAAFMVRKGRYKYIHYVGHRPELFDIARDRLERRNLAGEAGYAPVVGEYEALLRSIVDPEDADRRARADQSAMLERIGGPDAVLARASLAGTPAPELTARPSVVPGSPRS